MALVILNSFTEFPAGCFPLCQRFRKFRLEFKWKGSNSFRFLLTGIFGITSGGGPHISVRIFRSKFAVPVLTNGFFPLIREFGKRIQNDGSHFYWLARFNRKMSFHFPQVFPLISDRSVWHNGKHPLIRAKNPFQKWNGEFRSEYSDRNTWTTSRGDPEYSGQKKPKRTFPFEFQPKFPESLA